MTRRRGALLVVLVLVAGSLAAAAMILAQRATAAAQARTEALAAAEARLPVLLSYDRAHLDDDLRTALSQTTGSFGADYEKVLDEVVKPTATQRGITTDATVRAAGVVSGNRDRVVVLVFLTQTTTAKDGGTAVSGSRVEVTMERSGKGWKIAGLEPV